MRSTSLSQRWTGRGWYVPLLYLAWSRCYDWTISLDPAYRRGAEHMADAVIHAGDRVLDVGVGTGLLAELAATRSSRYLGIDYSGAMLERAARVVAARQLDNVSLRWGDARSLRCDGDSFDAVVSSFVLPHFPPQEKLVVLREMARVLRPGGRLGLFLARGEEAPLFSTRQQLKRLLAAAGLSDVAIEDRDDVYRVVTALKPS